jgi:hypothetical protein
MLCEYHAVGSITGMFMLRYGRHNYVHYEDYRPPLHDLVALEPGNEVLLANGDRRLRAICGPAAVSVRAFAGHASAKRIRSVNRVWLRTDATAIEFHCLGASEKEHHARQAEDRESVGRSLARDRGLR